MGGDSREYLAYAKNLLRGYFGHGAASDAYRSPGYPTLIAASVWMGGNWYVRLQLWQAILGAATVGMAACLARRMMPAWGAGLSGLLLAVWPHHIAFTAEILNEVVLGFGLTGALLLTVLAIDLKSRKMGIAAGVSWGLTCLINPIIALIPFILLLWQGRRAPRVFLFMIIPALLMVGLWSLRPVSGASERVWTNLVQGSWPLYHRAYVSRNAHPEPARIMAEIDAETALMLDDRTAGLTAMRSRMAKQPWTYVDWYLRKPYLLWDWDVRISDAFGPYVHVANGSPFDTELPATGLSLARALNPVIFWGALLASLTLLFRGRADSQVLALAFLYVTAVHWVLQAEPRYSVPYRAIEFILFCLFVCRGVNAVSAFVHGRNRVPRNIKEARLNQ
jgi:hypothetical protein